MIIRAKRNEIRFIDEKKESIFSGFFIIGIEKAKKSEEKQMETELMTPFSRLFDECIILVL